MILYLEIVLLVLVLYISTSFDNIFYLESNVFYCYSKYLKTRNIDSNLCYISKTPKIENCAKVIKYDSNRKIFTEF